MHAMQTVVTDVCGVCHSVMRALNLATLRGGHSVQPLPNHFGLLLLLKAVPVNYNNTRGMQKTSMAYISPFAAKFVFVGLMLRWANVARISAAGLCRTRGGLIAAGEILASDLMSRRPFDERPFDYPRWPCAV